MTMPVKSTPPADAPGGGDFRLRHHPDCVVCAPDRGYGLGLRITLDADGMAVGRFDCAPQFEGFSGLLHGGVIAALLDGAMTNCLFLHRQVALTAELAVRYRHPVRVGRPAEVRAWITRDEPPLFRLEAKLVQDEQVKATARGTFLAPRTPPT